ncbi:MAG TPA: homocysteine S-methyltransferase family protein [Fimbriimonadaceae bacterium]|nr:homocysteine S-methyltransferase family protein [Fimbriimonadaceae bacterium]
MRYESSFLSALMEHTLVSDGATGTEIQKMDLAPTDFALRTGLGFGDRVEAAAQRLDGQILEGCNEILSFTRPEKIRALHASYFEAGADFVDCNTFGATSIVLGEYDIPELVYDVALQGARIARGVADEYSKDGKPRFIAGGLGPGTKLVSLGQTDFDTLSKTYQTAATGLIEGGADFILLETLQDLLMVKATIVGVKRAMAECGKHLPIVVSVTMEQTGTMLVGSEIGAALNMVECFPEVVAFGLNCATGPVEMADHVRFLSQNSTRPITVQPNAGLPVMEKGHAVYKLTPEQLVEHQEQFVGELGVAMPGGCCGTTPEHIRLLSQAVGGRPHGDKAHWSRVRRLFPGFDFDVKTEEQCRAHKLVGCSSLYQFVPYHQDTSFLIVGERTNANGSKKFRNLLGAENWDAMVDLARELEGEGSHVIDVCTAYVGRDEERDMRTLLKLYNKQVTVPVMIDSTETNVVEASLQCLAGKPIINSINFEDGGDRLHKVLRLAREYGAAVVALTIDEDGMAKSTDRKIEVADRLIVATREYGLPDHDVFFDCLTFTLGSGDEEFRKAAIATIDAIKRIREKYPLSNSILGVSNISFGLSPAARVVLNSAFLHYALEAGLTSAIVHASKIVPESKIDPEAWKVTSDLVFDRREYAKA